jgi:hypothetical protein
MVAGAIPDPSLAVAFRERDPRAGHRLDRKPVRPTAAMPATADRAADLEALMAAPNINGITPNVGLLNTATAVTLTGNGFTGATAVTFGGIDATSFVEVSDTEITCDTPLVAKSSVVDVTVVTPGGDDTMFNGFTFEPSSSEAFFPAFTPIVPPPTFGLPPPPEFPPTTGTTPVPVPVGPLVGPAVASAPVPPSLAGIAQPQFGSGSITVPASMFPDFTTTFPNPPVSVQTTPPPPNMITTTPPVPSSGSFGHVGSLHHGDAAFPQRRAGAVFSSPDADELHQPSPPKGSRFKRVPSRRPTRDGD